MIIARTLPQLQRTTAQMGAIGLVPTMGALHDGHLALLAAARAAGPVVASIFVNPTQFLPGEDFTAYPRDEAADLAALEAAGCDIVWLPDVATMYPEGDATRVHVSGVSERWEGAARPGHFEGVATVVAKLFGQVRPARAYFGEKDWQQLQVVRRMVTDLAMGPQIVPVATVREPDGLALSSRNRFLSPQDRARAALLPNTMNDVATRIAKGTDIEQSVHTGTDTLRKAGFTPDYLALVDAETLSPLTTPTQTARHICAARLGAVRLLDNRKL